MSKKRGLGRGLSALIPVNDGEETGKNDNYREIETGKIMPNPHQPRQRMDEKNLEELMDSIKTHGLIQPIVVRPGEKGKFEIIAGERRWLACKKLNIKKIPAIIKEYNDLEATAAAIIENIQREDLNAVEEAMAYKKLMEKHGLTQEELSKRLGKSRSFIANMVRLLALNDEVKEMLARGDITVGHARALLSLPGEEVQKKFAYKIADKQVNVRETEEMVKKYLQRTVEKKYNRRDKDIQYKSWEEKLASRLGRKINIRKKPDGSGSIVIGFSDNEDLIKLVEQLQAN